MTSHHKPLLDTITIDHRYFWTPSVTGHFWARSVTGRSLLNTISHPRSLLDTITIGHRSLLDTIDHGSLLDTLGHRQVPFGHDQSPQVPFGHNQAQTGPFWTRSRSVTGHRLGHRFLLDMIGHGSLLDTITIVHRLLLDTIGHRSLLVTIDHR